MLRRMFLHCMYIGCAGLLCFSMLSVASEEKKQEVPRGDELLESASDQPFEDLGSDLRKCLDLGSSDSSDLDTGRDPERASSESGGVPQNCLRPVQPGKLRRAKSA